MSADDKFGIGAGLLALGVAASIIALGQCLPPEMLPFLPHREFVRLEFIFDCVVAALALPAGVFFFLIGILSGMESSEPDQDEN
jgi:hypothetical protein